MFESSRQRVREPYPPGTKKRRTVTRHVTVLLFLFLLLSFFQQAVFFFQLRSGQAKKPKYSSNTLKSMSPEHTGITLSSPPMG